MSRVILAEAAPQRFAKALTTKLNLKGIECIITPCLVSALELSSPRDSDVILTVGDFPGFTVKDLLDIVSSEASLGRLKLFIANAHKPSVSDGGASFGAEYLSLPREEDLVVDRIRQCIQPTAPHGLSGNVQDISLVDVIQMLVGARKSGELCVIDSEVKGTLFFEEGQVTHASFLASSLKPLFGEEAFLENLRKFQNRGIYTFSISSSAPTEKTINKRTDHLLLGLASLIDEGKSL